MMVTTSCLTRVSSCWRFFLSSSLVFSTCFICSSMLTCSLRRASSARWATPRARSSSSNARQTEQLAHPDPVNRDHKIQNLTYRLSLISPSVPVFRLSVWESAGVWTAAERFPLPSSPLSHASDAWFQRWPCPSKFITSVFFLHFFSLLFIALLDGWKR